MLSELVINQDRTNLGSEPTRQQDHRSYPIHAILVEGVEIIAAFFRLKTQGHLLYYYGQLRTFDGFSRCIAYALRGIAAYQQLPKRKAIKGPFEERDSLLVFNVDVGVSTFSGMEARW